MSNLAPTIENAEYWSGQVTEHEENVLRMRQELLTAETAIDSLRLGYALDVEQQAEVSTDKTLSTVEKRKMAVELTFTSSTEGKRLTAEVADLKRLIALETIQRDAADRAWRIVYAGMRAKEVVS